jgi:hypothetical protein
MSEQTDVNCSANPPGSLHIRIWQVVFFSCGAIALAVLFQLQPEFTAFSDRAIGTTVLQNVNPYYRNYFYALSVIVVVALAVAFFLFFPGLHQKKLPESGYKNLAYGSAASSLFGLLVVCAGLNILAHVLIGGDDLYLRASVLCLLLSVLCLLAGRFTSKSSTLFYSSVLLAWQAVSMLFMLFQWPADIAYWWAWLLASVLLMLVNVWISRADSQVFQRVPGLARLIVISPLLYIASNELSNAAWHRGLPLTPIIFFAGMSLGVWILSAQRLLGSPGLRFIGLCVLINTAVINEYTDIARYINYDLFHLGERIVPLQQWRDFSSLPFVDYLPVHGLFDLFPNFIYQKLMASSALESVIWGSGYFHGWFMRAIAIALLYLFLSRLLPPMEAFFLIWLLPSYHLIEPYYILLLLPALHLLAYRRVAYSGAGYLAWRPLAWWILQWWICIMLFLWRMDFGIVAVLGSLAVAVLAAWYYASWMHLGRALLSGSFVASFTIFVFVLLLGRYALPDILGMISAYLGKQILVASYAAFYEDFNYIVLMQYVIFPLLISVMAAFSLSRILRRETIADAFILDMLIVLLATMTLVLSLRSLQRHSLLEGTFGGYMYLLAMFLFVVRYQPFSQPLLRSIVLAIFIMLSFFCIPKNEKSLLAGINRYDAKWQYPVVASKASWPVWEYGKKRLRDKTSRFDNFVSFSSQTLAEGESFYDFSNAPMLYALAGVELPVYIMETVFQSTETIQKHTVEQLGQWYSEHRLPYVVFRQGTKWDALDGVDNALRSYLIAEFIYQHYRPCVIVDRFEIWLDRRRLEHYSCKDDLNKLFTVDIELQGQLKPLDDGYLEQVINFDHLPFLWANLDAVEDQVAEVRELDAKKMAATHWLVSSADGVDGLSCGHQACYLDVEIESAEEQELSVAFLSRAQLKFAVLPGRHIYRIRLSVLWHWFRFDTVSLLELGGDKSIDIKAVKLIVLADDSAIL